MSELPPPDQASAAQFELAAALDLAAQGKTEDIRRFLELLRMATLLVPTRQQVKQPDNLAQYNNEFLNLLALQESERIVVPIFTDALVLQDWSSESLNLRQIEFNSLIKLIPNDWWLVLNPGSDACKEFSPWELERLCGDEAALLELIEELREPAIQTPVRVEAVSQQDLAKCALALTQWAGSQAAVDKVYLAREFFDSHDLEQEVSEERSKLLIGIALDPKKLKSAGLTLEEIRDQASNFVAGFTIGDNAARVLCGASDSLALGVFKDIEPIYKLKVSFVSRFVARFRG